MEEIPERTEQEKNIQKEYNLKSDAPIIELRYIDHQDSINTKIQAF